jgi:hypothetical protein
MLKLKTYIRQPYKREEEVIYVKVQKDFSRQLV